ncbi:uncharacterized [Tachysurus ichikawai]
MAAAVVSFFRLVSFWEAAWRLLASSWGTKGASDKPLRMTKSSQETAHGRNKGQNSYGQKTGAHSYFNLFCGLICPFMFIEGEDVRSVLHLPDFRFDNDLAEEVAAHFLPQQGPQGKYLPAYTDC